MLITISIINYNYSRFLRQAIESALCQKADEATIEVLVVDDGSTDESDEVIAHYKTNPRFRSSKTENRGFGATLTRAVVEASGDYVFLMDADDHFAPDKVAAMLPSLLKGALYVTDVSCYIDEAGRSLPGGARGSTSTVAINRQAVAELLPVENELSFLTLLKVGRGFVMQSSHTFYRFHNNSMTNRRQPGKQNLYLAGVTHRLASLVMQLADRSQLPWGVTRRKLIAVSHGFRAQAFYNDLEAALELKQVAKAWDRCARMLFHGMLAHGRMPSLHAKMLVRTIIMRPSSPKQ